MTLLSLTTCALCRHLFPQSKTTHTAPTSRLQAPPPPLVYRMLRDPKMLTALSVLLGVDLQTPSPGGTHWRGGGGGGGCYTNCS